MSKQVPNVMSRVKTSFVWGPIVGLWALFYTIIEGFVMLLTDVLFPVEDIDIQRSFDQMEYNICPEAFGNHQLYVDPEDKRCEKVIEHIEINNSYKTSYSIKPRNYKSRYSTICTTPPIPEEVPIIEPIASEEVPIIQPRAPVEV